LEQLRKGALVGTGAQVAQKLQQLADQYQVDEFAVITWTHDPAAQHRSYQILAHEVMG
jgi:alkanesulfonate monooxygenase SsuD/methylene tetrahydromethanopterin reductase-like flavin-dependent oxidoreductase (luciferase family)